MTIRSTAASRTCDALSTMSQELMGISNLIPAMSKGIKSAKTVDERVHLQVSLEMFAEELLGDDYNVSTEGFKDTIVKGFKVLLDRLLAIINNVIEFFQSYVGFSVKGTSRLVTNLMTSKDFNSFTLLNVEDMSILGYGYSRDLHGSTKHDIFSFVLPDTGINDVSVEIVTALQSVIGTLKNASNLSIDQIERSTESILSSVNNINASIKPKVAGNTIVFNRLSATEEFNKTYPRENMLVTINPKSFLKSFDSWKTRVTQLQKSPQYLLQYVTELKKEVTSLEQHLRKNTDATADNTSDSVLLGGLTNLLNVVAVFQNYYVESINQSIRFNQNVAIALSYHFLNKHVSINDEGIKLKYNIGTESMQETPMLSTLAVPGMQDEQFTLDEDFMLAESEPIVFESTEEEFGLDTVGLESTDMVVYGGDAGEVDEAKKKSFIEKILAFLKRIGEWIVEKTTQFIGYLTKRLISVEHRLEIARRVVLAINSVKLPDFVEIPYSKQFMFYGPFDLSGKFIPDQLKQRMAAIHEVSTSVERILDYMGKPTYLTDVNDVIPNGIMKRLDTVLSDFERSFKNTGVEVSTLMNKEGDIDIPQVNMTTDKSVSSIKVNKTSLVLLSRSVGLEKGFSGLPMVIKELRKATSDTLKDAQTTKDILTTSKVRAYMEQSSDDAQNAKRKAMTIHSKYTRALSLLGKMSSTLDNFASAMYYVAMAAFKNNEGYATEALIEVNNLRETISSSLSRGGLSKHEASAINISGKYLKDTFGLEDFAIDTTMFIDPVSRKAMTQAYLNKLSLIV
jgi:hypothetical protein